MLLTSVKTKSWTSSSPTSPSRYYRRTSALQNTFLQHKDIRICVILQRWKVNNIFLRWQRLWQLLCCVIWMGYWSDVVSKREWCNCRYVATNGAHLLNGAITSATNGSAVITGSIVGNGMYLSAFYAHITPQYGENLFQSVSALSSFLLLLQGAM